MPQFITRYRNYQRQQRANSRYSIRFYNFWKQEPPDMWFYRFIESRQLLKGKNKIVCFYSVFGERNILKRTHQDVNVFFTGENLKREGFELFADHFLNEEAIGLALGFERFDNGKYMRFPLWLMYMFDPEMDGKAIEKRCAELRHPQCGNRNRFACHVSSGDELGIRKKMCVDFSQIGTVDCAGKLMHNCDDLWEAYGNDKKKFISEYKFNLCPENSDCHGYVTEKLFQAIDAGCIPIYWGSGNNPEPEVLNQEAVVFWNPSGGNTTTLDLVRRFDTSPSMYDEFVHQPRLKDGAAEYVIGKFNELENRIRALL